MAKTNVNSPGGKQWAKDTNSQTQIFLFQNYLKENVVTCTMASKALGIPQKNLTWYKRTLEKAGLLWEVYHARCQITRCVAAYLTTDPEKAPKYSPQLSLF